METEKKQLGMEEGDKDLMALWRPGEEKALGWTQ